MNRVLILIILIELSLSIYFIHNLLSWKISSIEVPKLSVAERIDIEKIHNYHGIIASESDMLGRWWFYRDGDKCWIGR
jgi:hypothetical protein